MANEVQEYNEDYFIEYFAGESPAKINKEQFEKIENILLDTEIKFVKIGDNIVNTSAIKQVSKVKAKRFPYIN